jgi:hypothetical protein
LFHQLGVRAIINNILAEDRSSQWGVYLLGIDVLELSIEDKFVAFCPKADSGLFAEKNEGEDITILQPSQSSAPQDTHRGTIQDTDLFAAGKEEFEWINAICNGTADEREQVEDDWRFIRVLEQQLLQHVEQDSEGDEGGQCNRNELPQW